MPVSLAGYLLDLHGQTDAESTDRDLVHLPANREELVARLGMTPARFSAELVRLSTLRAISLIEPDMVRVLDRSVLETQRHVGATPPKEDETQVSRSGKQDGDIR